MSQDFELHSVFSNQEHIYNRLNIPRNNLKEIEQIKSKIDSQKWLASELYEKIRKTCMPHGEFKRRYWFFADTPNIAKNCRVIGKDLL